MSNEISLFDESCNAVAYIAVDDEQTIYLWEGTPVAYLYEENVYGFNGVHLGWFIEGVMFGRDGCILCTIRSKFPRITRIERIKRIKKIKRIKRIRRIAPIRPIFYRRFSANQGSVVLASGRV